ncbi:SCO1664 family protein [Candidatus Frankia nodulisporulans]|uniref:SCO1664 family protein n=1 Tax=Candidatus Frankia nodulisporulans TaxID=2060052 RepID=UPI0013D8752D|nr:SCO1664 family protein [Candidatus Frankia nodulisporulans]
MGDTAVGPTDLGPGRRQPLDPLDCGGLELDGALDLLAAGELTVTGRMTDASNATLYCEIAAGGSSGRCVYKPIRGERALWDFPDGTLAARELAAYEVSAALGLGIVPPTIMRDGPFGPGMVQLWIDTDVTVDLVALTRSDDPQLRRIALFDAVINNADRKGGHLLPAPSGRVHGIDHGVTFHAEGKLRTLLWTWRGRRLSAEETALLRGLAELLTGDLGRRLEPLLTVTELTALDARLDGLLDTGRFPLPSGDWPPIPWPPF